MPVCSNCRGKTFIRDDVTENLSCSTCGKLQEYDNYVHQYGGVSGPTGTFVSVGTTGSGNVYSYKETKVYEALKFIESMSLRLGLSTAEADAVKAMAREVTVGEYGQGNWFNIFVGACAYVAMRRDNKPLPIAEVVSVIGGTDVYELGRMIMRVVNFLDLKKPEFPEFDIVNLFERMLRNFCSFEGIEGDKRERMRKQGIFLLNCAKKWFLTTGRRPLPMVAAVLALVAELNGVGVRIEDLAKEIHAVVHTCKLRYRELLEALVKVAQALPWGKDVTVKNVIKNAPFVIQYMERKSMSEPSGKKDLVGGICLDLGNVREYLRNDSGYASDFCFEDDFDTEMDNLKLSHESRYFEVEDGGCKLGVEDMDSLKLSHECLSMIYSKFSDEVDNVKSSKGFEEVRGTKKRQGFALHACAEWWNGQSEMSKRLLLKEILEKDVGLDAIPPSFVNGCVAVKRRKEKINAAKQRIDRIMCPDNARSGDSSDICISEEVHTRKKRKRGRGIDWEDLIIETLLLHKVKEEEIEKGWYNVLLELYVFNSGVV
ncbi:plant-specific TFIIB-related protein PTF2 [Pyrus communis]|uniref:plant-specific TFIIB-related protein PTF2 n=1 Tax=Pyrus communis TaxID=23211 RepID=UPI0035BFEDFE